MDDQKRPNGIPVTRFMLQSIYAQTDDEKLEFEYESGTMNIIVSVHNSFNLIFYYCWTVYAYNLKKTGILYVM